uniref:Uncharacterized protein n=1 Tax=Rhizophora mucronata TaxID=61149 RepID=A0A2P2M2K9_RHIMU
MPCLKRSPRFWHLKPILAILESYRLSCCNFCNGGNDISEAFTLILSLVEETTRTALDLEDLHAATPLSPGVSPAEHSHHVPGP